jgi:hypothetical protein
MVGFSGRGVQTSKEMVDTFEITVARVMSLDVPGKSGYA